MNFILTLPLPLSLSLLMLSKYENKAPATDSSVNFRQLNFRFFHLSWSNLQEFIQFFDNIMENLAF